MSGGQIPVDYSAHDDSCTAACNKNPVWTCSINKLATTRSLQPCYNPVTTDSSLQTCYNPVTTDSSLQTRYNPSLQSRSTQALCTTSSLQTHYYSTTVMSVVML